jgi:uncharacterized membrane protein YbhN (UPF0104 family)
MRAASLVLRVVVTVGILALVLRSIDAPRVGAILAHARPGLLAAALALQLASSTAAAYRWHLVMGNLRFGQAASFYVRSFFKGLFFNQALPGVGGDAFRVIDVARRGFRKRDALYAIFLDRLLGFGALMLLSLGGLLVDPGLLPAAAHRAIAAIMAAGVAAASMVFWVGLLPWPRRDTRLVATLLALSERARRAVCARRAAILAFSLLSPLLAILCFHAAGRALGLPYGPMAYVVVVPPALVLSALPVSIAGWGVREGALVGLFALAGADKAAVLTLSLLYGLMVLLASLPGLAIFLGGRQNRAKTAPAP